MRTLGVFLLLIGIILGIYALSMDTSVKVNYSGNSYGMPERVNNIGLMNDRQNYIIISGILTITGVLIILFSKKNTEVENNDNFQTLLKKAKLAEYKEDFNNAYSLYMETLYHLEKDTSPKKLNKKLSESRNKLIETLKNKAEEIKSKQT